MPPCQHATVAPSAAQAALELRKGTECLLVGGTYQGCIGWLDKDKAATACQCYVIIMKSGTLKLARVNKESVGNRHVAPTSFVEAAFQQHKDLDECMGKLVKKLAQCRIDGSPEATAFFRKKLDAAYGRQMILGSKAVWKDVDYEEIIDDIDLL
jgi:hypothetical protein